jgi:hypothetical protein
MPDEPQTTLNIALPATDWQVIHAGLLKLPGEVCIPVLNRLQLALTEAQKPHIVPLKGENDG